MPVSRELKGPASLWPLCHGTDRTRLWMRYTGGRSNLPGPKATGRLRSPWAGWTAAAFHPKPLRPWMYPDSTLSERCWMSPGSLGAIICNGPGPRDFVPEAGYDLFSLGAPRVSVVQAFDKCLELKEGVVIHGMFQSAGRLIGRLLVKFHVFE